MNVSGISPTRAADLARRTQDFDTLQSALQNGSLPHAQSAFAAFQQDVQKTALTAGSDSLFAAGSQPSKDLQTLGNALKSSNLTAAQQAFASLKQDLQAANPSGQPVARAHSRHPQTHAELAANGVSAAVASTPAGSVLNLHA